MKVEVYRRFAPVVQAKCARMLRDPDEARDVVQETFRRLFAARLNGSSVEVVTAWIYKTSTRLALDALRRRKVRIAYAANAIESSEDMEGRAMARATLERMARDVPRQELIAVVLHRVDGLTQSEVAEVVGSSERTVRRLLKRFEERRFE